MRVIANSDYLSPTKPIFEKFNTLDIFDMYKKEVAVFMFKYKNDMLPVSFEKFFIVNGENHNYNTRNRNDFEIQIHKAKTIFTMGPKIWNQLPNKIKSVTKFGQFKTCLKSMLQKAS